MNAMEAQLRETYARWDTEGLIDHFTHGGLTETATRVLRKEIAQRNVSQETLDQAQQCHDDFMASPFGSLAPMLYRLIAHFIDCFAMVFLSALLLYVGLSASSPIFQILGILSFLVVFFGYPLFKDGIWGQGIGKRMLEIRVVDSANGVPCTLVKSLLRGLLSLLGPIDLLFFRFNDKNQRLGDLAASTLVVKATFPVPASTPPGRTAPPARAAM